MKDLKDEKIKLLEELRMELNKFCEYLHANIDNGRDMDFEEVHDVKLAKIKRIEDKIATLTEQTYTNDQLIDFVNWYLRLCKVVTDEDCRFELENQTVIDSFLKGDDYKLWWRDDIADKRTEQINSEPKEFRTAECSNCGKPISDCDMSCYYKQVETKEEPKELREELIPDSPVNILTDFADWYYKKTNGYSIRDVDIDEYLTNVKK